MGTHPGHVIVVGGGIAGIAAALRLGERGVRVTVLETRKKLGGRATSFDDVRTGATIDNCQHVALGCCTNFLNLLERLGSADAIEWQRDIYWYEQGGRTSVMSPAGPAWLFPAPGHYGLALAGAKFLTIGEKAAATRAMLAMLRADRSTLHERTFGAYLRGHGQGERLVRIFWEPVVVSACNLSCERVSAAAAVHVFQEGFLAHRDAAAMGVPRKPLRELYDNAERLIAAQGGALRLGAGVRTVWTDRVELTSGETIEAERVVCTVPPERALKIVAPEVQEADARFAPLREITHSPILGVHLTFDRPVLQTKNAVLIDRPTQWLFRKEGADGGAGSSMHAVISAADDWLGLDESAITQRVCADIRACLPGAADAQVVSSRPVMEKFATFAPTPGVERLRPAPDGPSGVVLAGCYIKTGWPATMEGATRSGEQAAACALGEDEGAFLQAPLMPSGVARALGGVEIKQQAAEAGAR